MGAIISGVYYPNDTPKQVEEQTAVFKQSDQARQRKDHARDLVQPFTSDGKVNSQFLEAFPQESKERGYYGQDQG